MRNLFYLIERFHLVIVFLILEGIAFSFIRKTNTFQDSVLGNNSMVVSGKLYTARNDVSGYFNLKRENERLALENAYLLSEMTQIQTIMTDSTLPLESEKTSYQYKSGNIIDNSITESVNYIIVDKGSEDNVKRNQGVIVDNGVVGVVVQTSRNYSKVMSAISTKSRISVRHDKSGALGNLTWNGNDPSVLNIENVNKANRIEVQDTFSTAGYSSLFPPNVSAAVVTNVHKDPSSSFLYIEAKLSYEIDKITHVYIVDGKDKDQIDSLKNTLLN